MTDKESLISALYESIHLIPYDPQWPHKFQVERERLLTLFPDTFLGIEHIGSTAIAGMEAKPIIDLIAGVSSFDNVDLLGSKLCESGYITSDDFNKSNADRKWFMRASGGRRTHHLHLVIYGSETWLKHIEFRDRLRTDSRLASDYRRLKSTLAQRNKDDREAYTNGKSEFVKSILDDNGTK